RQVKNLNPRHAFLESVPHSLCVKIQVFAADDSQHGHRYLAELLIGKRRYRSHQARADRPSRCAGLAKKPGRMFHPDTSEHGSAHTESASRRASPGNDRERACGPTRSRTLSPRRSLSRLPLDEPQYTRLVRRDISMGESTMPLPATERQLLRERPNGVTNGRSRSRRHAILSADTGRKERLECT